MKNQPDWEREIRGKFINLNMRNVWKIVSWTVVGIWLLILIYIISQVWS